VVYLEPPRNVILRNPLYSSSGTMSNDDVGWIVDFIWGIADDVLRDVYVRGKYRDVILPMTVIRRLDAVLEPSKQAVLKMKALLDQANVADQHLALCNAAGEAFYNTSRFALMDLKARANPQQLKTDFEAYLDGFSPNVQEILDKFQFRNQISRLVEQDILDAEDQRRPDDRVAERRRFERRLDHRLAAEIRQRR